MIRIIIIIIIIIINIMDTAKPNGILIKTKSNKYNLKLKL